MKHISRFFLPAFLLGTLLDLSSCTKAKYDDDFKKGDVPPIGSYTKSDDVAAANLVAHWTFDNTNNEAISNTAPTSVLNNTFVPGVKGQALHLNKGYLLYPAIDKINTANGLGSVSVSLWINVDNNGSQATEFFALSPGPAKQSDWGSFVNIYAETGHPVSTDDTLALHAAVGNYASGSRVGGDNINDYGTREQDFKTVHGTNRWVHYVMVYDGSKSTLDIYANNVLVSNNNFRVRTGLGSLVAPVPMQALIGAFPNSSCGFPNSGTQSWQALLNGSIDEIRVFSKALSTDEIHALYFYEKLGS